MHITDEEDPEYEVVYPLEVLTIFTVQLKALLGSREIFSYEWVTGDD